MKMGADRVGPWEGTGTLLDLLTNQYLVGGVVLFALNVVFYVAALTKLNLSVAYPVMMAGGVLIVVCVSILYFKEPMTLAQGIGVACLLVGLALVTHRVEA
jgi:small multidrug resistance pump